jgi:hypothetical protein
MSLFLLIGNQKDRVFMKRVVRIFGPKGDEVTGGCRKLHIEELYNLHSSPSIIKNDQVKEDEMDRTCSTNGKNSNAYRIRIGGKARRKETTKKTKM